MDQLAIAAVRRAQDALRIAAMPAPDFSVAAVVRALASDTWGRVRTPELAVHRSLVEQFGEPSRAKSVRLPAHALRDMTAAGASGSNYLVATELGPYINALQPRSVVLSLGAGTFDAGLGNVVLPKGTTATVTTWLSDENAVITEGQPVVGQIASTPKVVAALTEVSHQMLKQSNAEEILRGELNRAAAAAIDAAALAGSGASGQPLGIINVSGIGAFTGTTLNRAALTNAQRDVGDANAMLSPAIGFATTPTVAELLQNRADTIASTQPVWQGNAHDGELVGARAMSTTGMPAASMLYGDWSNVTIVSWGTPQIAVDPMTKFNSGLVAIRLMLLVDVVVTNAAGFSLATSIT